MAGGAVVLQTDPWGPSNMSMEILRSLIDDGLLRSVTDPNRLEWIAPGPKPELRPRDGYIMSFVAFHEHGLGLPTDRFMRALLHYYGVELHNFNPNSIAWFYLRSNDGGLPPYTGRVVESQPEKWWFGVPKEDQPKLQPLLEGLERLRSHSLMVAMVVAAFHRRRVLPLMAQRWCLFEMTPDEPIEGIRMSVVPLSDEEIQRRVRETVEGRLKIGGLTPIAMHPLWGFLSLGMRDVQASPPPIPEDAKRRAVNRAHAKAQKKKKNAEEAKGNRKILEHEELERRHRKQRHEGLPVELSLSPSSVNPSSDDDDDSEVGRGPLDYLPNVRGMALGASASGPTSPGEGGEGASGLAIARPRAEADTPKAQALGKHAISPVGSTVEVEQAAVGVTQAPPQKVEGAPESGEGRLAPADMGAMPLAPLWRRDAVSKRLCPRSSRKRQAEVPVLAPHKALKVSTGSIAQGVVEAQSTIQRGAASARTNPKEPVAQGGATEAVTEQAEEEESMPQEAEAHKSDGAEAPSVSEATEGEAEAMEAEAPETTEAKVVGTGASKTTKAGVAGAGVSAAKPAAQKVEIEARQASTPPPVQGPPSLQESAREVEVHSISSDDTSRGKEVVDTRVASTMELPAPASSEGSSALVRELKARSLRKSLFLRRERDIWDQLWRQWELLANANELLST
ncbi:uncharacterized protein [Miscanthus floridulus]|uniref:uncharacterized protein n=1 Tax=Miscanthus floridulus TaxID=154761 RepID=UPI00345ACB8A